MASQVLSGPSNPTYTNNTGQNVRLILSMVSDVRSVSWAGVTAELSNFKLDYPNTLAPNPGQVANVVDNTGGQRFLIGTNDLNTQYRGRDDSLYVFGQVEKPFRMPPPYQLTLAPGQTFSAVCGPYNIIVIKEDGT